MFLGRSRRRKSVVRARAPLRLGLAGGGEAGCEEEVRKQSFFEKRDQKTFIRLSARQSDKSFLLLFFKKEVFLP